MPAPRASEGHPKADHRSPANNEIQPRWSRRRRSLEGAPRRCPLEGARHLQLPSISLARRELVQDTEITTKKPPRRPFRAQSGCYQSYRAGGSPLRSWASQRPAALATGSEEDRVRASATTTRQPAGPVDTSAWAECMRIRGAGSRRSGTRRCGASAPRTPGAASTAAERRAGGTVASEASSRISGAAASGRTTPSAASARARRVGKARGSLATASTTGAAAEPIARHSATVTVR